MKTCLFRGSALYAHLLLLLLASCINRSEIVTQALKPTVSLVPTVPVLQTTVSPITSIVLPTASPISPTLAPRSDLAGRKLIFQDEFSGSKLNEQFWVTEYPWGRTNLPEAQYFAPDAFELNDGILRIKAEKRSMGGQSYTSGAITSFNRFTFLYGYIEMRAKLPSGQGLWPAFWMLPENEAKVIGEIDIFELLGHEPDVIYMSSHFPDNNGNSIFETNSYQGQDFSKDFHTFAVEWRPDTLIWYIDGDKRSQLSHDVPNMPMFILTNLAVGGKWPGYPDETTRFPAYFDIDYIRVYQ